MVITSLNLGFNYFLFVSLSLSPIIRDFGYLLCSVVVEVWMYKAPNETRTHYW